MIAGHLREKDGHYYCVLSYTDYTGERKQIWKSTGLPVKGNKKRAANKWTESWDLLLGHLSVNSEFLPCGHRPPNLRRLSSGNGTGMASS